MSQPRVQLPVADVQRNDTGRSSLQQAVGKAAGRGTDVERRLAGDVEREHLERPIKLFAAAPDEAGRLGGDQHGITRSDQPIRFRSQRTTDEY